MIFKNKKIKYFIFYVHSGFDKFPFIFLSLIYSLYFYPPLGSAIFWWLQKEDGILENFTALFFVISSILFFKNIKKINNSKEKFINTLMSITFFLWSIEEISWGQRIFNFSFPLITTNNTQNEITIHNLDILQPYISVFYIFVYGFFTLLCLGLNNFKIRKPNKKLLYYFFLPFLYYLIGSLIRINSNLRSYSFGIQEIFEFIFSLGILKYSKAYFVQLRKTIIK